MGVNKNYPKLKRQAIKLRKKGWSYGEIRKRVNVSKSTLSLWCRDVELTIKQKARLIAKKADILKKGSQAIMAKRKREIRRIKRLAKTEISGLTPYQFKIAGVLIYWAEGSKNNGTIISNSDPALIKFMVDWFKRIHETPPEKLKARLNIHADQNDAKIKRYWSKITGIPLENFGKSYIKPEGTGHRKIFFITELLG